MGKVAFLYHGEFIYWRSVIWAIAVLCALLMAVAIRLWQKKPLTPLLITLPIAVVLSVYFARAIHWYCRFESYNGFAAALKNLGGGGYSLIGAFAGTILAALLVRALQLTKELPPLLDALAPAGAFGIAVGRWAELFTAADRGKMILEKQGLPFTTAVTNSAGVTEWRFATFAFQSIWVGLVFVLLLVVTLVPSRWKDIRPRWRSGNVFCLFILLYCLGQILLDSTRYDALFLRSNGFVSLVQIVCAVSVAAVTALYSVRSIQINRFRWYHPFLWFVALLGLGLAGFMEWYVQRHGDRFVLAYDLMAVGLLVFLIAPLRLRDSTRRADPDAAEPPAEEETAASAE